MTAGIILAAGESRRIGTPKPLLKIAGKSFLWHIVHQLGQAEVREIVVVVGHEASRIIDNCDAQNIKFVNNQKYNNGQFSSLQTGIRSLDKRTDAAVICLVDQPHVQGSWIRELVKTLTISGKSIAIPKYQSKRGHPVVFSSLLFEEIINMAPTDNAHILQSQHANDIVEVDIPNRGILLDVDYPRDIEQITPFFES